MLCTANISCCCCSNQVACALATDATLVRPWPNAHGNCLGRLEAVLLQVMRRIRWLRRVQRVRRGDGFHLSRRRLGEEYGMTRFVLYAAAVAFVVCCAPIWSGSALADSRVALVIGNSAYQLAPTIPNPTRDAQAIAAEFKKAGFDVVSAYYDQGNLQFKRAIRQFEDAAADADIAVVF